MKENANKLHFKYTDFNSHMRVTVYSERTHRPMWFTVHRSAKFGSVPFADLRLRSVAMKYNAEFTECE